MPPRARRKAAAPRVADDDTAEPVPPTLRLVPGRRPAAPNRNGAGREDGRRTEAERAAESELRRELAVIANRTHDVAAGLEECVGRLCRHLQWPLGHVLLEDQGTLVSSGRWFDAAPERFAAFREAAARFRHAPGAGLAGRALSERALAWSTDVSLDAEVANPALRRPPGVRGGLAVPIVFDREVIAVIECWSDRRLRADEPGRALAEDVAALFAQVVARVRARAVLEESVREQSRRLADAREHAVQVARVKAELLASMSHEIRTPMNAVLGMVRLMLDGPLEERQREFAGAANQAGENLLAILDDILDLSRLESGGFEVEHVPFDLHRLLRSIVKLFEPQALDKALRLELEIHPGTPAWVDGDPVRVRQVLTNLLGNAFKFTPRGSITLRARRVSGDTLCLEVEDTGAGVPEDEAGMTPEADPQDPAAARRCGGAGLALTISRRLVRLMHGELTVHTRVGVGSTFGMVLPLPASRTEAGPASAEMRALAETPRWDARVLVVDDVRVNRTVAIEMLRRFGCTSEGVDSGAAALQRTTEAPFDVVLLDCQMPELDGYATVRILRERGVTLPVVAMTANALPGDRERCIAAGMDDYVTKPVRPEHLQQVLERWADHTRVHPADRRGTAAGRRDAA